jgi:hypothetical protein
MLVQLRLADIPAAETGRVVEVRWLTFLVFWHDALGASASFLDYNHLLNI